MIRVGIVMGSKSDLPVMEAAAAVLDQMGIELACAPTGEFLTVQEMAGFQMFVAKLDDEMIELWNAPCDTPALTVR